MKKIFLMLSAALIALTSYSCGAGCDGSKCEGAKDCKRQECCAHHRHCHHEMSEEQRAAFEEMRAKWENFDNLSAEEQAAILAERKARIDERMAFMEARRAEMEARRAEMEAKCAEFKAKWDNFDNLSVAEQKALIDELDSCRHRCHHGDKACCHKECKKGEGACKHKCQHPCKK